MNILDAPNVCEVRTTCEDTADGFVKCWNIVLTDLKLDVNHKEYNKIAVDALIEEALKYAKGLPSETHVMIVQTDDQSLREYIS